MTKEEAVAAFTLVDQIRDSAYETMDKLQKQGYEVALITGDNQAVAKAVVKELDIKTEVTLQLQEKMD